MTAKEAASRSPEGCAERWHEGNRWIWKADVNLGFRCVEWEPNGDPKLFVQIKQEQIDALDDWLPMRDGPYVRNSLHRRKG